MTTTHPAALLTPADPPAFEVVRPGGSSHFLLTADHASRRLPAALGALGLSETDLARHIAWDIGIEALGRRLAERLDAVLILQNYSRLAIDANRPPGSPQSIATRSEATDIPGNVGLSQAEIEARQRELFWPYQERIRAELDARERAGRETVMIALHSFTPVYLGVARPWHAGVLYNRDARFAHALLAGLRAEPGLTVGDNEPYALNDATDYTIPVHAERRRLPHVELEIRQDLIAGDPGLAHWVDRLVPLLERAFADVFPARSM